MAKKAVLFNSKKLYDNQIPNWIEQYLHKLQYRIAPKASYLLAEYLGTDLSKISNELDKLTIITPQNKEITSELIEKNIGISKDYNNFELTNALAKKDVLKSIELLTFLLKTLKTILWWLVLQLSITFFKGHFYFTL